MTSSLRHMVAQTLPVLIALSLAGPAVAQGLSGQGSKPGTDTPPKTDTNANPPRTGDTSVSPNDLACFPSSLGSGHLRVEWPDSKRWAIFAWPPGSTVQVYVGPERARWCWGKLAGDVQRCIIDQKYTRDVPRGGC
jgi:hypothetical protein